MSLKAEIEELHERMVIIANEIKKLRGQQSVVYTELLNCDPKFADSKMVGGTSVMGSCSNDVSKAWEGWQASLHNLGEQINERLAQLRNYSEHYDGVVDAYKSEFPEDTVRLAEQSTIGLFAKHFSKVSAENFSNFLNGDKENCLIRDIGLPLIIAGLIFLAIKK